MTVFVFFSLMFLPANLTIAQDVNFDTVPCSGFEIARPSFFPFTNYDASAIKTADVNNDGISDLLVAMPSMNKISVQTGNGEGGITATNYFDAGNRPADLDLGDFNRDGEIDIVVANPTANQFSLLLGDGAGNFSLHAGYAASVSSGAIKVGNFDGDEYLDVAVEIFITVEIAHFYRICFFRSDKSGQFRR